METGQRYPVGGLVAANLRASGIIQPPEAPLEHSTFETALLHLECEADALNADLTLLYERLGPYLANIPTPEKTAAPIYGVGDSTVVRKLCELSNKLAMMHMSLELVKARLEL